MVQGIIPRIMYTAVSFCGVTYHTVRHTGIEIFLLFVDLLICCVCVCVVVIVVLCMCATLYMTLLYIFLKFGPRVSSK